MPNYNNYPMAYGYNYGPQSYGPQSTYTNPQMISQIPQQPMYNYEQPQQPVQNQNPMFNMFGGFQQFQQNFNAFVQSISQQGMSPQQMVQGLLDSGKMSQDQFNQFSQMANMLTGRKQF